MAILEKPLNVHLVPIPAGLMAACHLLCAWCSSNEIIEFVYNSDSLFVNNVLSPSNRVIVFYIVQSC